MVKDGLTALNSRNQELQLPLKIEEQWPCTERYYFHNTIEEIKPLSLVETCYGFSEVQGNDLCNLFQKASLADKSQQLPYLKSQRF